jgi:hypothetical protein
MERMRRSIAAASAGLLGAAVVKELRRTPGDRTWHGRIFGVPYDLRPPTTERLAHAMWDKDNPSIFGPTALGVGWTVNLYRLVHRSEGSDRR